MTDYERGIRDAIMYRMTHIETMRAEPGEPRTENDHYRISFEQDRVSPSEHAQRMVALWQAAAVAALIKGQS